ERIKKWQNFWTQEKISKLENDLNIYGKKYGFKENAFAKFISSLKKKHKTLDEETQEKLIELFGNDLINKKENLTSIVSLIKLEQDDKTNVYNAISTDDDVYIVDKKYITDKVVLILQKDFNLLVIISLSVVFLILLIYFGRIELTLITILPMLVSWIWTLTIMWIFNFKFTIFNIIISTFIFGLGIDYSIFITQGLLQKYRYGKDNLPSFKTSVLLSAITTVTSIGVLIFAKHPAMRSIAFLSVIGITSVVFVTYTLQPLLFNFLIKQQGKKRSLPITFKDLISSLSVFLTFFVGAIFTTVLYALIRLIPFGRKKQKLLLHKWLKLVSKAIVYIPVNIKKIINNPHKETFEKPAVIIANHQAHIDITLLLMLHSKIIILTNDWVQNNIFYGRIVKFADFLPTSNGFEKNKDILKEKIKEGYSILIFPEGTRSKDLEIKRFHKGAFEYAKELGLDVLPIIIQGAGDCIPKGEPFLKSGQVSVNILERINVDDYGEISREQAKNIRALMQNEYKKIRCKYETPKYFRRKLILNYIYKTPVLEHYTRIKTRLENNYEFFNNIIPKKAHITDIGTGYGYLPYMLSFVEKERTFTGIDYDCTKINTAQNNISKTDKLNFICGDALQINFVKSDVFTILDVLHYMPKEKQKELIVKCIENLKPTGKIIIRDGNSEMEKKHKGTKLTEFFSTKLLKFNKTEYDELHFTSKKEILEIVEPYNFDVEIIDETKFTSNIVFVLKKL
ncbi:MAG: MMPL family transporter, partial [Chlorobi bacterium]|nr:MMPL family transporter [Chlorobiota bacterium]